MITSTPNDHVKPIHTKRMPVILDIGDYARRLADPTDGAAKLLKPFPSATIHIATEGDKSEVMRQVVI